MLSDWFNPIKWQGLLLISVIAIIIAGIITGTCKWILRKIKETKNIPPKAPHITFISGYINKNYPNEYRIDIPLRNVGNSSASIKVIDGLSRDIIKAHIGVPTIVDSQSMQSNISIWLKERDRDVRVAIALYYWDTQDKNCYRTISYIKLRYTENAPDVYAMIYQKIDKINKHKFLTFIKKSYKEFPKQILQWDGERKNKNQYFTNDWLQDARNYYAND
ncbi:MAG: hypothetical protein FIA99_11700 [Ruminiclostridium sp.]|nr:hypothetical protein [Ruminiclostridium sp.]